MECLEIKDVGFYDQLTKSRKDAISVHSCISSAKEEMKLRSFLQGKNIDTILEIGTWKGVSTCLLAYYANKVITIDICNLLSKSMLWLSFGVIEKIQDYEIFTDRDKEKLVDSLDFDFAFIDAEHSYEGAKIDFEITKRCGRVLFHDYWEKDKPPSYYDLDSNQRDSVFGWLCGVRKFVDTLPPEEITILEPFAYWERNGSNTG